MPINYAEYHPKWSLISRLIRFKRAENKCEQCGRVNYVVDRFLPTGGGHLLANSGDYQISHYNWGPEADTYKKAKAHCDKLNASPDGLGKWSVVVLTVAHLDHDKTNNRFDNLAALCQKCHLSHDSAQHVANRKYGRKTLNLKP